MPRASDTLTQRALNRATLARQMLLAREQAKPSAALERVGGLQAQWPRPPFIGLWSRLDGFEAVDFLRALHRREAIRATMMRGTLFVTSARDYARLRPALQPMMERGIQGRGADLETVDLERVCEAARDRFREPRTFEDMRDFLVAKFPKGHERLMGYASRLLLPLVMEPTDDTWGFPQASRFVLADAWLAKPVGEELDPADLLLRYFGAFGPATVADAQNWSGLRGLKPAVEALRPKLATFRDERGRELFDLPKAPRPPEDAKVPVRFLPEFDNVLLGHDDRKRFIDDKHKPRVYLSGLRVAPTFLVDGFVAGTWKIERKKKAATLAVEPFGAVAKGVRDELAKEAERLVRFVEPSAETFAVTFAKA